MTQDDALAEAIRWKQIHDEAEFEEANDGFARAEELRIEAADLETDLRAAGFDAWELTRETR